MLHHIICILDYNLQFIKHDGAESLFIIFQ